LSDYRLPILCRTLSQGIKHVRAQGVFALDPRWYFVLTPAEIRAIPAGSRVVDALISNDPGNPIVSEMRKTANARQLDRVPLSFLQTFRPGKGEARPTG
jgi:hypothetical protein